MIQARTISSEKVRVLPEQIRIVANAIVLGSTLSWVIYIKAVGAGDRESVILIVGGGYLL